MSLEIVDIKMIVKWVAENAERGSVFLYPHPRWNVDATGLLDRISEVTGIDKQTIGEWVEEFGRDKE